MRHVFWNASLLAAAVLVASMTIATAQSAKEVSTMKPGRWEGEYLDVEGHRGKLQLALTEKSLQIQGDFDLTLSTEDRAEKYLGTVAGSATSAGVTLQLQFARGGTMTCHLKLREPRAYAEQAAVGTAEPVPELKLGGGAVLIWKFSGK